MRRSQSPPVWPELLLCLALLRRKVPLSGLCQMLGQNERSVSGALLQLESKGLVRRDIPSNSWAAVDDHSRGVLGRRALKGFSARGGEPFARGLFLLWSGHAIEGGGLVRLAMEGFLNAGLTAAALLCMDILMEKLKGWTHSLHGDEENSRYLGLVQELYGLSVCMCKRRRQMEAIMGNAFAVAEAVGDRRSILHFNLMQLCQYFLGGGMALGDPLETMREIVNEIHALGDPDILAGTGYGIGLQYLAQGDFPKALASYQGGPESCKPAYRFFCGVGLFIVTTASCCLGRFDIAFGSMRHALRSYELRGQMAALRSARMLAGNLFLHAGRPEEALEMTSDALTCSSAATEPHLVLIGLRNLAFYHYQNGRLRESHQLLRRCVGVAGEYNIPHPYIGFPDIFDMLWTYQEAGLEEMPDHTLEQLLERAGRTPNRFLRAIALRIRARQLLRAGGSHEEAIELLEASLMILKEAETPVEYARTGVVLAACLRYQGLVAKAEALHEESRAILGGYRQYDCPPPFSSRSGPLPAEGAPPPDGAACVARCEEAFASLPVWTSFEEHTQRLVECVLEAVRAEDTALFARQEAGGFTFLAGRHVSEEERRGEVFAVHLWRMRLCLELKRIDIRAASADVCLYMPLEVPEGRDCVLMLRCSDLTGHITGQDASCFEAVQNLLETELRLAFRLQQRLTLVRLEDEKRSRAAQERQEGALYYGPSMLDVLDKADKAAPTDAPVLILGETGVGKEELARRIHANSGRSGPFVALHPASIPEQLFESELFGHEKGAFTGAHRQKIGLAELADQGTLFIDEIGDIPPPLQAKLLRVLQDKSFMRLGGLREIRSDFRLLSATNRDMDDLVRRGIFREDLYYRVAVVPLLVPPLRERPEDIRELAVLFHGRSTRRYQRRDLPPLRPHELDGLCARSWPGNVRELKSFIERAVILADANSCSSLFEEESFEPQGLPRESSPARAAPETADGADRDTPGGSRDSSDAARGVPDVVRGAPGGARALENRVFEELPTMKELQIRYIRHVLSLTRGKISGEKGALQILGMKQSNLYSKIREYGLDKTSQAYGRAADE